jgi:hypothetical protein
MRETVSIDLNWGLYEYARIPHYFNELKYQSKNAGVNEVKILSDTDNLIHSIIHGSGWNPVPSTRWILDAALLINKGNVDWEEFTTKVINNGWQYPLIEQLKYLQEFGILIPNLVQVQISTSKPDPFGKAMHLYQRQPKLTVRRFLRFLYSDYLTYITVNNLRNDPTRYLRVQTKVFKSFIFQYIHAFTLKLAANRKK